MFTTRRLLGCLLGCVIGLSGAPSLAGAQQEDPLTLLCQGRDRRRGDDVLFKFRVSFRASEVVYLDNKDQPVWAAPAVITTNTIRWNVVDFSQFPDADQLRREGVTGQVRTLGRWPYGPSGWVLMLKGVINRLTGTINGPQSEGWDVPRFREDEESFTWVTLEAGTCRIAPARGKF